METFHPCAWIISERDYKVLRSTAWIYCMTGYTQAHRSCVWSSHRIVFGEQFGDVLIPPLRGFFLGDRVDCCTTGASIATQWTSQQGEISRCKTCHTTLIYSNTHKININWCGSKIIFSSNIFRLFEETKENAMKLHKNVHILYIFIYITSSQYRLESSLLDKK